MKELTYAKKATHSVLDRGFRNVKNPGASDLGRFDGQKQSLI